MKTIVNTPVFKTALLSNHTLWINLITKQVTTNRCNTNHKRKHNE